MLPLGEILFGKFSLQKFKFVDKLAFMNKIIKKIPKSCHQPSFY